MAGTPRGRAGRLAGLLVALAVVLTAVPFLNVSGASGGGFVPAHSNQSNSGGFPEWYQDANGVRIVPCLDPALVDCLAPLSNPGIYDTAQPQSFPTNYPDEIFYSAVDAALTPVADCAVTAGDGVTVHLALEASFAGGVPAVGDQTIFGRIRFNAKGNTGLCPNTWYTFRTPYGPYTMKTGSNAEIVGKVAAANTTDIGCITAPCTFNEPFLAPVLSVGLLRLAAGATPGYLGESTTFGPIEGGNNNVNSLQVVRWPANVTPAQSGFGVDCTDVVNCKVKATQNNFNVLAKLAGPLDAALNSIDFGGVVTGQSAQRPVGITNLGSGPTGVDDTTIESAVVTGPSAASYAVSLGDCSTAAAMTRDATCTLQVTFSPTVDGAAPAATLVVTPAGGGDTVSVQLAGTGVQPDQVPVISVNPTTVDFGDVRYRTGSETRDVTITNSGIAPLTLEHVITNSGGWADDFSITSSTCPTGVVAPNGGTCVVSVRFVPSRTGLATAELLITSNDLLHPSVAVTLMANAWGGVSAVSADRTNGFPNWYQDERGVRVGQCADPTNTLCIAAPIVGPLNFPDNYPDEAFYYIMNSDDVAVSDTACDAGSGVLMVEAGVEAAFFTTVADGDQMTFGRIRFVAGRKGGLCPDTRYEVTYPYGKDIITTDADGVVKPSPGTTDIGCGVRPCDFAAALSSPVIEGFLEQTGHPAGYLGNPTVFNTVTGAPYIDPATGQPANHVVIRNLDTGVVLGSTDRFGVSGRLAGPVVASPAALDLGAVPVSGGVSSASTVLSNVGPTPVTLDGSAFSVSGTGDFTVDLGASTCQGGTVLAPNSGDSCTVVVAFDPSTAGQRTATLVVNHDGLNDPLDLSLVGVGQADPLKPAISVQPGSLVFTDRSIATVSETQTIVVSNLGGQAPLTVGAPSVDSDQYVIENLCVLPVDPDLSCAVTVRFQPTVVGAHPATVTIPSDAGTVTVALSGDAVDVKPSVASVHNSANLPIWVQDDNGVRLQQCLTVANCVLLGDATFDPGQPVVYPSNYPTESFYFLADSELLTFGPQICADGSESAGGTAFVRIVTEASFAGGPAAGAPAVFNRIRVIADGLCANSTYHFQNPFGDSQVTTDGDGAVKNTLDITNLPASEPVLDGFIQWDPNIAPAAPAGHLGDGATFHEIVGSNYRPDPLGEPVNYIEVQAFDGTPVVRGDRFIVAGQMAGPVVADAESLAFGAVRQAHTSNTQSVTISNIGKASISSISAAVSGADAGVFTVTDDTCTGATLANDQACTITLVLDPSGNEPVGDKAATLVVTHGGLGAPISVSLSGKVITSAMPALAVNPAALNFTTQTVNTFGTSQTVTIRNTGTAPMHVAPLAITGGAGGNFQLVTTSDSNRCTINGVEPLADIAPNASCTITVQFAPTSIGAKAASIVVNASDPAAGEALAPFTVSLAGTATQGTASLSASTLSISGRAGRTATASVRITNNGTANFTLVASQVNITANINPATVVRVTGNTCANIAPRKTCQVTVSFAPPAGGPGTVFSADIYLRPSTPALSVSNTVLLPDGSTVSGVKFRVNATRSR